ncbi:MAG: hypothetical protein L0I24_18390 [Pseudonocardia sp.]|nr:hypothetical protein [Pseudonocardia sp.]
MSTDYPLLAVPGYELYQLAPVATFIADGLVRHRRAAVARARPGRRRAARDVHAGRAALANATGDPSAAGRPLPRPLDTGTYRAARGLLAGRMEREALVVSLSSLGRDSWAVVGFVPGLGPVGAEVTTHDLAGALREHILTRPARELVGWSVTDRPLRLGQDRWGTADEAAAVADLDPRRAQHQAVARHLRGVSSEVDGVIAEGFAGVDLDAASASPAPSPQRAASSPTPSEETAGQPFRAASRALAVEADDDALELLNQQDEASGARAAHGDVPGAAPRPAQRATPRPAPGRGAIRP